MSESSLNWLDNYIKAAKMVSDHYGKGKVKVNLSKMYTVTINGNTWIDMLSQIGNEIKTISVNLDTEEILEGPTRFTISEVNQ